MYELPASFYAGFSGVIVVGLVIIIRLPNWHDLHWISLFMLSILNVDTELLKACNRAGQGKYPMLLN
jgi:hypothetical protein